MVQLRVRHISRLRFHMFAICADKKPNRLLHEMEGGESLEVADALENRALGALSPTPLHPADTPGGGLEVTSVRAPDGERAPEKETNADGMLCRESESFRPHQIACENLHFAHGCIEYCMRAPRRGGKRDSSPGEIPTECRMGKRREATPGHPDAPGWETRPIPTIAPGPRGYANLATDLYFSRTTQHSGYHTISWMANGDLGVSS